MGAADIKTLKSEIRQSFSFGPSDLKISETRPSEELWVQRIRNIVSHRDVIGNFIHEGLLSYSDGMLRITPEGRALIEQLPRRSIFDSTATSSTVA
jgi:hypothetical protein